MGLTFGLGVPACPPPGVEPRDFYPSFARAAEQAGVERLWVGDHALWHQPRLECFALLSALAGWTGLALGSSVALAPLRHPLWLARSAASVDRLCGGRFILGIGAGGEYPDEFDLLGIDRGRRGRLTDAALALCRKAWAGALHPGFEPRPAAGDIPIWVGGRSEAAARRAGAFGDGYIGLFQSPDRYAATLEVVRQTRETAGRAGRPAAGIVLWTAVEPGAGTGAAARAAELVASEYRLEAGRFERHVVAGSAAEVAARLREYAGAGVEHVQLQLATADPVAMLRQVARVIELA